MVLESSLNCAGFKTNQFKFGGCHCNVLDADVSLRWMWMNRWVPINANMDNSNSQLIPKYHGEKFLGIFPMLNFTLNLTFAKFQLFLLGIAFSNKA